MAKSRVPSPKDVIRVRRLPKVGDEITIKVKVTRVVEPEGSHAGLVTYEAPGAPAKTTVAASYIPDQE